MEAKIGSINGAYSSTRARSEYAWGFGVVMGMGACMGVVQSDAEKKEIAYEKKRDDSL